MFFTPILVKRLRLQAAEIRLVIRGIDETLVEVVNDINTLVGITLLNCLSWHKHFAHGQVHKALNVNQCPSTKTRFEFSGIR